MPNLDAAQKEMHKQNWQEPPTWAAIHQILRAYHLTPPPPIDSWRRRCTELQERIAAIERGLDWPEGRCNTCGHNEDYNDTCDKGHVQESVIRGCPEWALRKHHGTEAPPPPEKRCGTCVQWKRVADSPVGNCVWGGTWTGDAMAPCGMWAKKCCETCRHANVLRESEPCYSCDGIDINHWEPREPPTPDKPEHKMEAGCTFTDAQYGNRAEYVAAYVYKPGTASELIIDQYGDVTTDCDYTVTQPAVPEVDDVVLVDCPGVEGVALIAEDTLDRWGHYLVRYGSGRVEPLGREQFTIILKAKDVKA